MRRRRLATPDDLDLLLHLPGKLRHPPVVCNRGLHVEYAADGGMVRRSPSDLPTENRLPLWTFTATFSPDSVQEGEFTWIVQTLDAWAVNGAALTFVAAPRRVSAFYDESGVYVPFPAITFQ